MMRLTKWQWGNAACSEESASAAAEMSSQAASLRNTVDELDALISGSRAAESAKTAPISPAFDWNAPTVPATTVVSSGHPVSTPTRNASPTKDAAPAGAAGDKWM
jgi:hypothetical protein